jgi:hypothetical protein
MGVCSVNAVNLEKVARKNLSFSDRNQKCKSYHLAISRENTTLMPQRALMGIKVRLRRDDSDQQD